MKLTFAILPKIAVLLLLVALSASAQQQGSITGGLNGVVTDSTGAVLPDVTVTLVGPQGTRALTTDSLGRYSASGLTPGFYDVTVEKSGFKKVQAKHSEVVVNSSSTLNLSLQVGDVSEVVEVTSSAVAIDTQSTAITSNLTDTFYNSVPMPRNVSAIFYAAPGVASGQVAGVAYQNGPGAANPSIGGASGLENLYVVDGVTITDQAFGSIGTYNRFHGSLGTGINLAFIKEVDVKTTAFEPQYGKATGGIVQIVTKSGGNQYHGAVAAYFGPGAWYANRYQFYQFGYKQLTPPSLLSSPQYDAAAELGGYIPGFRDKLFFFGAFNPSLNQTILLANPNAPAASRALGALQYSTTTLSWAGKLTYKFRPATTFEASSFGDPSRHNSQPLASGSTWQLGRGTRSPGSPRRSRPPGRPMSPMPITTIISMSSRRRPTTPLRTQAPIRWRFRGPLLSQGLVATSPRRTTRTVLRPIPRRRLGSWASTPSRRGMRTTTPTSSISLRGRDRCSRL